MINKLWTGVSLENYNNWYPLTGKITETPPQYIKTWPNVNDWFKTFAIRAQNDINAYLGFILSKFPFDSFKDELIKETLRDMVYVTTEHWVFNRTPIEFNVDATIQFNNGSQFSASSIPTINIWDLAPSRMKIWARLTELKQILSNYNDDEIDVEKIDLKAFYTRNQVDELIEQQKEFTLSKQIKLYDDLVDDNENEIYRGPVSKFVNKGYVATDYDKETETMILDWPDEIGTLPPEALQNNPQIGDYTHAPTCDFSAKQQKQITTNENEITKLNSELIKANENINDVKNNWFNIETSPLWKKVKNENIKTDIWYIIDWTYYFIDSKQLIISNNKLTKSNIRITNHQIQNRQIIIEKIDVNIDKVMLLYDDNSVKFIVTNSTKKYTPIIHNIYQYQGTGTPTEFIAEEGTERDYYTKLETNNLLDKKQNKLIAGENIKIDEKTNTISTTGGSSVDENRIFNNKDDKDSTIRLVNEVIKTNVGGKTLIYRNNPVVTDDNDIPNKKYIDDKIPNLDNYYIKTEVDQKLDNKVDIDKFQYAFTVNALGTEIPNLETTDKTIAGGINENKSNIYKKQDKLTLIKEDTTYKVLQYKNLGSGLFQNDLDIPPTKFIKKWIDDKIPNLTDYYNKTEIDKKLEEKANKDKWVVVGKSINKRTWTDFKINTNQTYRVLITWETKLIGYPIMILFKTPKGINSGWHTIINGKIDNEVATLDIMLDENMKSILKINGAENNYKGEIISLEIKENEWDIDLRDNDTPTPSGSNWKEVGTREKNKWDNWQITYDFQENKHYRVYYSWSIYNPVYTIQEFIITNKKIAGVQIQTFNDSANIVILSVQHAKWITIYTGKGNLKGNVWKLEELQE